MWPEVTPVPVSASVAVTAGFTLCLQAFLHSYWVSGATMGALLSSLIPASVRGLSFAMTGLLTVLGHRAHPLLPPRPAARQPLLNSELCC